MEVGIDPGEGKYNNYSSTGGLLLLSRNTKRIYLRYGKPLKDTGHYERVTSHRQAVFGEGYLIGFALMTNPLKLRYYEVMLSSRLQEPASRFYLANAWSF